MVKENVEQGVKKYVVKLDLTAQEEIRKQITELFKAEDLTILNNEGYEVTAEILKLAKGKAKEIKEFYTEPKKFAHEIHKEIVAMEKDDLQVLDKFEEVAKDGMTKYLLMLETPELDEETGEITVVEDAPKVQGVSVSDKYDFEIVDADLIPREYLIPNERMIRDMVKASNGEVDIPGVKIIKDKTISVRAS